jgi:putative thiamine transport system ATP-binding protein
MTAGSPQRGLALEALTVAAPGHPPLVRLTARIAPGEVLSVMGPSGSGKSTLLAALTGTLDAAFRLSGRAVLNGVEVTGLPARERRIGILFQDPLLFPHLSVAGNLAFAVPRRAPDRAAIIDAALAEAGLPGFGPRDPATLSGGERARVALMRTLLAEPQALLLDEPFSRLDAGRRAQIRGFVFDTARQRGLPVVLVTHDAEDAHAAGGRILSPLGQVL